MAKNEHGDACPRCGREVEVLRVKRGYVRDYCAGCEDIVRSYPANRRAQFSPLPKEAR